MSATSNTSRSSAARPNSVGGENVLLSQLVMVLLAVLLLFSGWSLFVLLGVGPAMGFHVIRNAKPPNPPPNIQPQPHVVPASGPNKAPENVVTIDYPSQERNVVLKMQRREFEARTTRLSSLMDTAEQQWKAWQLRVQQLLTNDEGRGLATSAPKVRFLFSKVPCDAQMLRQLRADINSVRDTFSQATAPLADLNEHDSRLTKVESDLQTIRTTFEFLNHAFDELIAESKEVTTGPTLEDAIAKLNVSLDDQVRLAVTEQLKALRDQQEKEINAVNQKLTALGQERLAAQEELKRAEADAQRKLDEAQSQSSEQSRDLEQKRQVARKKMEEALPAMRDRLAPFISKGYRQLKSYEFEVVVEAQPFSYGALIRMGALNDDAKGLNSLFELGGSERLAWLNDRPLGSFPKITSEFDIKKPDILRDLKAVQAFLRQHGEAMVEAKLLAP